ncbi:MAG: outer membrane protein assembly factor BamA [Acidobacteriota bacterium]|nr:outer membrane protein assembly factor BamA [Acidobacteriota bacterium]
MNSLRQFSLNSAVVCLCGLLTVVSVRAQNAPAPQTPASPQRNTNNPFENVPQAEPSQPAQPPAAPQFEAPKTPEPGQQPGLSGDVVEGIEFRGARRVPQDTLRAMIFSKSGDVYNADTLRRDFMALWNTNRFDDIKLETEKGDRGGVIVRFVVTERPVIRDIKYEGAKAVSTSDILDRFKERKVGLTVESMYDPNVVNRAAVVLKELEAEHGHQFATVNPELRRIPPSSLEIVFTVVEGPKIKVGKIMILGNEAFTQRDVVRAMKNLHPLGIPYSIFLEDLFPKTFDAAKLEEDKERIRDAYQKQGYFTAKALDQTLKIRDVGGANGGFHIPLLKENKPGKVEDITIPVEEGQRYHLARIDFEGVKLFRSSEFLGRLFQMQPGDVFSTEKLRSGLKNLTKVYSQFGYIDYVAEPQIDIVPNSNKINLTLNADEGKQFFVRRIDFTGNTTTRDKVIRREILIDEGDVYNSTLWDASILRLNQLGYFEALKENESYELKRNAGTNTVDINLKVKERGKNSIGLNGGVSGTSGTFIGLNYSTNNFLGLGETLTANAQVGTLQDQITLGFTEPYLFDRPLQAGVSVYLSRYNYNQGQQASILSGVNLESFYNSLGSANVLNYVQNSKGITFSTSYPIKRSFARLGVSIGYDDSSIVTKSTGAQTYFTYLNFLGVSGPNALSGIKTLSITPSYTYNSKNSFQNPTAGKSIFFSIKASGSVLGANVNTIQPTFDAQYYHTSPRWHKNVLAFHFTASTITGYGGKVAPPFARSYIGGENDIRGFDSYSVGPIAFMPSSTTVNVLSTSGTQRGQGGALTSVGSTVTIPTYQIITPGGDTHAVFNFEYRIPIFGPVTLVPFFDAGANLILYPRQLTVNASQVTNLNNEFPSAAFTNKVKIAAGTQTPRISTGLELDIILPIVQAPFRIYYAYNPSLVRENITREVVLDQSTFANGATLSNALSSYGSSYPLFEKRGTFRFTIGRTF